MDFHGKPACFAVQRKSSRHVSGVDANKNNGAMFSQSMIVCAIYSTKFGIIFPVVIKMIPSMIHDMLFVFALSCYLCFFLLFVFHYCLLL